MMVGMAVGFGVSIGPLLSRNGQPADWSDTENTIPSFNWATSQQKWIGSFAFTKDGQADGVSIGPLLSRNGQDKAAEEDFQAFGRFNWATSQQKWIV